jgi:hypothetical protein
MFAYQKQPMNSAHLASTLPESHVKAHAVKDIIDAVRFGSAVVLPGHLASNGCRVPAAGLGFFCDLPRLKRLRGAGLPNPELWEASEYGVIHPRILDMGSAFIDQIETLNDSANYTSYGTLSYYGKATVRRILSRNYGTEAAAQIIGLAPLVA